MIPDAVARRRPGVPGRQRGAAEQHAVDDAEDQHVGADRRRQGDDGSHGKGWSLQQAAKRMSHWFIDEAAKCNVRHRVREGHSLEVACRQV